ncbi:MAG: class I SAM-dependent methyltransferase [Polyangiaceae bacterium]
MQENIAAKLLEQHRDYAAAEALVDIEGLSSARVCRFLNDLVRNMAPEEHYLEVGTWKGRTLMSAAIDNPGRTCFACDKFRLVGRFTGLGCLAKQALYRNIERYQERSARVVFHHTTSARLFREQRIPPPIGVYFYDGDHSFAGTYHGIASVEPLLASRAVVLVDDWNDPVIRGATREALRAGTLDVLWERELEGDHTEVGWWNGLGVFYVERRSAGLESHSMAAQ